jgi:dinuclear metal center YbgI/SA1388 family protein
MDTVAEWVGLVHDLYPPGDAEEWDEVGLQVGDPTWPVERVVVTLDVTGEVIAATEGGPATLVLAHHPTLFRPLSRLTPDTAAGRVVLRAARSGVAVLAAHTNLDVAEDGTGTSDPVVRCLGLTGVHSLTASIRAASQVKLATFVPADHVDAVLDALAAAGAGSIGEYERCSFRVTGTGTFTPGPSADPYSGEVGVANAETEDRLEMVLPRSQVRPVVAALRAAHPYEEVAYDLYPLIEASPGLGLCGDLPQQLPLRELAEVIGRDLPAPHLRVAGDRDRLVRRVAVVGGAGVSLAGRARAAGADVLVTGDVKHHEALDAREMGLSVIDAGHHATEVAAMGRWRGRIEAAARDRELTAQVVASNVATCPWCAPARQPEE